MNKHKINITTRLDFTTDKTSLESIKKQIELAVKRVNLEVGIDPKDRQNAVRQLEELGRIAEKSFNESTKRVNKQMMDAMMINSNDIAGWDSLDKTLRGFGITGTNSFNDIKNANQLFNAEIETSESALDRMGQTLMNTIRWNISSKVVNSFTGAIQEAYYFAKDLDRELTNIQIVSGTSADEMARFADEANKSAKALGTTTIEYAKAATLFYQQGLRGDAVTDMTDAATVASNITGEEIASMSDLLTSTMNGYKLATDEVMHVVDMMANVGANTASDFNELATAMSKVASMASSADVPMESLIAQLATIMSVTRQSPETVGTALKTVYGRMVAFGTDLDAIFEEDGEVFSAPKVEEAIQAFGYATDTQLTMFKTAADGSRQMRELGDILADVGNAWDKTTDKSAKFALTTAMAGNRQQNNLVALFDSWEEYGNTVELALDSEGTGMEQNEVHLESYEGKLQQLQASKEKLFMTLTNSDGMKTFIDFLVMGVDKTTALVESTGGLANITNQLVGILGSLVVPVGLDKLGEAFGSASGAGIVKGPDYDAQIEAYRNLQNIEKAFGSQKAETHREAIRQAEVQHGYSRVMTDLYKDELSHVESLDKAVKDHFKNAEVAGKSEIELAEESYKVRQKTYAAIILEQKEKGLESDRMEELRDLEIERQKITREGYDLTQDYAKMTTAEAEAELDDVMTRAEEVEAKIAEVKASITTDAHVTGTEQEAVTQRNLDLEREKAAELNTLAVKRIRNQTLLNGAMKVGLPLILTARDATSDTSDLVNVLKMGVVSMLPQIVSIAGQMFAMATSAAGLAGVFTTFVLPLAGAAAVIGGIVALIRHANKEARELVQTTNDYEEALDLRDTHKANAEALHDEHKQVLENIREIEELEDPTGEDSHRLNQFKQQNIELERQIAYEEYLAELAAKEASDKAFDLFENTQTSEHAYDMVPTHTPGGYDGEFFDDIVGSGKEFKDLKLDEEVVALTEAMAKTDKEIQRFESSLNALNVVQADSTKWSEDHATKYTEQTKKLKELTAAKEQNIQQAMKDVKALEELASNLDATTDKEKEREQQIWSNIDTINDYLNEELGLQQVREDGTIISAEEIRLMSERNERISEYRGEVIALTEALGDANISETERLGLIEDITEAMGSMLDMDISEDFFHQAENVDLLQQAMEGSDSAWLQLRMNMAGAEIDIAALATQYNVSGDEMAQIIAALDTLSFTAEGHLDTTQFFKSLEGMGEGIGMANALIDQLGNTSISSSMTTESLLFNTGSVSGFDSLLNGDPMAVFQTQKQKAMDSFHLQMAVNRPALGGFTNPISNLGKGGTGTGYDPNDVGKKSKGGGGGRSPKGGSGGRSPKGGGGGSGGSGKDEYGAEADAYARINRELGLNSTLMSRNNALQTAAGDDLEKKIGLMEEEIKLNESRQASLHKLNQQQREEMKKHEKFLAGQGFGFEGSGDNRRITDATLGNIAGKSKEVEEVFNRFNELQEQSIPGISQEWWGLENSITGVGEAIKQVNSQIVADRISSSRDWINKRQYYDDWGADNEIAAWDRVEDYIRQYYADGKISYKEFSDYIMQISRDRVAAQNKLYDDAQKKWLDTQNKGLQEKRDGISALEDVQSIIVDIIRKRGEKEREIEQKNHTESMEELSEKHQTKMDNYQEELDEFSKMIQGKIDALDDQWEEDDYLEALDKEKEIQDKIQKEINDLSLDDSLVARNKKIALEEQLVDQTDKIAKMQQNRDRKLQKDALSESLKEHQELVGDKRDIAEQEYKDATDLETKRHEAEVARLDEAYSNANVYAEARMELIKLEGKTAEEQFDSLSKTFEGFSKEFGEGMGILGGIIQKDFISQLEKAQGIVESGDYFERPRDDYESDYKPTEGEHGWIEPPKAKAENRPSEFDSWSQEEYDEYIENKKNWTKSSEAKRKALAKKNADLRAEKWGEGRRFEDEYTAEELEKMRSYAHGGKINYDGLAVVHGEKNPEWIFNDRQLRSILEATTSKVIKSTIPNKSGREVIAGQNRGILEVQNLINIEGNVDEKIMPELKQAGNDIADIVKNLNKSGVFRGVKL